MSGLVKLAFFIGTALLSLLASSLWIIKCEMHVLAPMIPICVDRSNTGLLSTLTTLGLCFFQIWFFQVQAASFILYIDLLAAVVLVGHYMACEMV